MLYDYGREFFLVTDDDTGETKLFKLWHNAVEYIARKLFDWQARVISTGKKNEWRAAASFEEMFNTIYEEKMETVNEICEAYFVVEKIEFSD